MISITQIRIDPQRHLDHPWRVHELLSDFAIEDVWRVPVDLKEEHSLDLFLTQFTQSNDDVIKNNSLAGLLFKLRFLLGRIFRWDEKTPVDHLLPGSLRERYAHTENLTFMDLPEPGTGDFTPVYQLENEYLSEIENKTVHAALHLGRVKTDSGFGIQMAVYVKPRGTFGSVYMKLIQPFRHWVVYPTLMRSAKKCWEQYIKGLSS